MSDPTSILVEHFFRRESARLVAVLTRVFGWRYFDLVEEMVQATLLDALQAWRVRGVPENPSGWIHRVARNKVLDALRRGRIGKRVLQEWVETRPAQSNIEPFFEEQAIEDSELRMIFACCHPRLAQENQLALALKALCGFGNAEIARALLVHEETIKKRLQRATRELSDEQVALDPPKAGQLSARLDSVHQVLYLMFNEGYSASKGESAIRGDLCEEAARLCHLLCQHPECCTPATRALMALMLFHAARLEARLDAQGSLLLMEEQDRGKWDRRLIHEAYAFLEASAEGECVSRYHLEAGIAFYHCSAQNFAATDWKSILQLYDALIALQRSPVYLLNRAIVIAQIHGPRAGIRALDEAANDTTLRYYHWFDATLGELYRLAGDRECARQHYLAARAKTNSPRDWELIDRRLAECGECVK